MTNPIRSLLEEDGTESECKSTSHVKGSTYSLFGTIAILNKMKYEDPHLHFEYVLGINSANAFHQNNQISTRDSNSDIYLIFEENQTDRQKMAFYDKVHHELDAMLDNVARFGWNKATDPDSSKFHTFWVQALRESEGYLKVYILSHDETARKLRNRHETTEDEDNWIWDWQPNSIIFPVQKNREWTGSTLQRIQNCW